MMGSLNRTERCALDRNAKLHRYAASLIDFGAAPPLHVGRSILFTDFHIDLHRLTCLRIHSDLGYS